MSKLGGALKPSKALRMYNVKVEGGTVLIEVSA
jgi:nitrite reductase/ring-hydroxylating ferredoxin subunit